nr:hypothetical protein [Tanacetum cinerariifolium]
MHHVPIVAYSEIGLSLITTQIGKPIMLDTYTSNMCLNSWGRSTYARALIEVAVDTELKELMIIAIPLSNREVVAPAQVTEDGFTMVKKKKMKAKNSQKKQVDGVRLTKPSFNLQYHRIEREEMSNAVSKITQNGTKDTNLPTDPNLNIPKEVSKQPTLEPKVVTNNLSVRCRRRLLRHGVMRIHGKMQRALLRDTSTGSSDMDISMREFKECMEEIEVMDVQCIGLKFTWNQKPKGRDGVLKKLDRILANLEFYDDRVQSALDSDPFNVSLWEEEATMIFAFNDALIMEKRFLKQKSKIEWLKEGDSNSAYFHKVVKSRVSRSRIDVVTDANGVVFQNEKVVDAFISHYEVFLGQPGTTNDMDTNNLFQTRLTADDALNTVRVKSDQEVKEAMFSIGNDKSPGPDGYTAAFFKEAWDTVGSDVTYVVREFFVNGHLLKEINHTIIALIPKVKSPARVNDYRLISCCNVIFKCISKIITNRIKESLKTLISPNQSDFVLGRSIANNILLTQEIMHNYHLNRGVARYAFKVDIQKAYDMVDWAFLKVILTGFGFHDRMVAWIMECVATTSFSISINGSLHGHFKGKGGLQRRPSFFLLVHPCYEVTVIKEALDNFNILPFEEGRLPVKYLCVPLVSSRLIFKDCKELIEKGVSKGKAKVSWEVVCLPKDKGGLGVRRLDHFNKALMISHIWKLLSLKESLWVRWIHAYKLKGRSFWDITYRGTMSWGWRKIL